jgi:hypothetical protein
MIEIGHKEPVNLNSSDSELIAVALIAAKYFHGNIDHAIILSRVPTFLPECSARVTLTGEYTQSSS